MNRNLLYLVVLLCVGIWYLSCGSRHKNKPLSVAGFDKVIVGGELSERLNRNFDRMETDLYQPNQVYGNNPESQGWPADKEGRTILALVLDAQATHRKPVYLEEIISLLPEHLNAKGFMGTIHNGTVDEQQLSGHGWLLRGLCEYYAWKRDPKVLQQIQTIVDSLFIPITPFVEGYPLSPEERVGGTGDMSGSIQNTVNGWHLSSDVGCVFIGMEGLIHAHQYVPSQASQTLIEALIAQFLKMDPVKIKAQTHATLTAMRGLLRYATLSGDTTLIPEVETRWKLYKEYGMTENYENYNWFGRYDTWTEPCAIIDSYLVATQLWAKTRNPLYLEDAEKIYLNGIAATQRTNGGFGCDRPTGMVYPDLGVHCDEAHWCCTMRGGEGLGRAAEYSYFTEGNKIIIPFYRESTLTLPNHKFTMEQHTQYPFGNRTELVITNAPNTPLILALVAPSYMTVESLTLNGEEVTPRMEKGFMELEQTFHPGDKIELNYSFSPSWAPLENHDITDKTLYKATYGPLVLGYTATEPLKLTHPMPIVANGDGSFRIDGTSCRLTPLYHLMDSSVCTAKHYHRMVTVKIP